MVSHQAVLRRYVVIQRNPNSGSGWRRSLIYDLVRELKVLGFTPRLFRGRERLDAWLAIPENRAQVVCLVAAGGDGTVGDLLNRHPGMPLALLPVGTENLLARGLGIPASGQEVARLIAGGCVRRLDLCRLGERRFTLMASAGFDAEVIRRVHARRSGHISYLSYFQPIAAALRSYTHPPLSIWFDDDPVPETARLVVVVNFPMYALRLPVAPDALPDDGWLEVRLFRQGSAFQMLRYFCNLALGRLDRLPDVARRRARVLRIESAEVVPVQVDGDPAGVVPAVVEILPGALDVFVPVPEHPSKSLA